MKYICGIISAMIRAMKTIKRECDSEWYHWGPLPLDFTCPLHNPLRPCVCSPFTHPHSPFSVNTIREGTGGRCIQVGLFQAWFSPAPVGTSRGPLAHDTGRAPVLRPPPPCEPQHSRRGSRKLLDFPVAAAFARNRNPGPAPPERPGGTRFRGLGLR